MFSIAICDDQHDQLKAIGKALDSYAASHPRMEIEPEFFANPLQLIGKLSSGAEWDAVILDVCMAGMMGTEAAREIRKKLGSIPIIFISISREYAVEAFSLNAVHYLVKPYSQDGFDEALDRALGPLPARSSGKVMLKLRSGILHSVDADSILFIESVGYSRLVHTDGNIYEETRKTLSSFMEELGKLRPGMFIQPYRGYIVNMEAIRTIEPRRIVLRNGEGILIKRGDFRRIRDQYFSWSFGKG